MKYFHINNKSDNIFEVAPEISEFLIDTFLYSTFPKVVYSYISRSIQDLASLRVLNCPLDKNSLLNSMSSMKTLIVNDLHNFIKKISLNIRVAKVGSRLVIGADNSPYIDTLVSYEKVTLIESKDDIEECKESFKSGTTQLEIQLPSNLLNALLSYMFPREIFPPQSAIDFLDTQNQWDEKWFLYNMGLELQNTIDGILLGALEKLQVHGHGLDITSIESEDFNHWRNSIISFSIGDIRHLFLMDAHNFDSLFCISEVLHELLQKRKELNHNGTK